MRSSVAVTLLLSALGVAACSTTPAIVAVPDSIKAAADEQVVMVTPAKGVQIYECRAKAGQSAQGQAGAFEWAFVGPEAALYNTTGTQIGRHYGGPTWEANDGSKLVGSVKGRADAPQKAGTAAGSIPWLLLPTTASGAKGSFSDISAIQRVNTVGGIAPIATCGAGNVGSAARVPYTADYYMLAKK
jgi:hypothetical protein